MANEKQKVVIGKKQILRELKANNVAEITIATNVDHAYAASIIDEAKKFKVPYRICGTSNEIAEHFSIDVPSGAVGKLK